LGSRPLEADVSLEPAAIPALSCATFNEANDLVRLDDLDGAGYARTDLGGSIRYRGDHPVFDRPGRLLVDGSRSGDARLSRVDAAEGQLEILRDAGFGLAAMHGARGRSENAERA